MVQLFTKIVMAVTIMTYGPVYDVTRAIPRNTFLTSILLRIPDDEVPVPRLIIPKTGKCVDLLKFSTHYDVIINDA